MENLTLQSSINPDELEISTSNIHTKRNKDNSIVLSTDGSNICPHCFNLNCRTCKPIINNKNPPGFSSTIKRVPVKNKIDTIRQLFLDDKLKKHTTLCPFCNNLDGQDVSKNQYQYRYMLNNSELLLVCPACLKF